ncbi:MAG: saccharopine dehydrogenase family protein [Telluria sp.]
MPVTSGTIAVYGAGGHTGKFVINELRRRGVPLLAVGRDASRLPGGVPARAAAIDDPAALDHAFVGCAVVINCAGPFLDTAPPVVEAALRNGCSYIDVTAEQASAQDTFTAYDRQARAAGATVIPAAGFFGGLADLLASAVAPKLDEVSTAIALDHWWPTEGTRKTGARNQVPRVIVEDGDLVPMALPAGTAHWHFSPPFGNQAMVELTFSEIITMAHHLGARRLRSYLNAGALEDVRNSATPSPSAVDAYGRSAQRFTIEVLATGAQGKVRARASGQDIYAVSAPLVVEAAVRMLDPSFDRRGALALGEAFDARDFLDALAPAHLAVEFDPA